MTRARGFALAVLATGAALALQYRWHQEAIERYDRQVLPAFDAYVYMAMADAPRVFTLPPWGYRITTPWIVHALPFASTADGFRCVTFGALTLAGGLLFLFLRRLGNGPGPALVAVAAYGLSSAVGATVSYVFLSDPLTLVLELLLLLVLEAGAGVGVLALIAVAGTLTKEAFLLLLPAVYFLRREREGDRRAAAQALGAVGAALAATLLLRSWTPYLRAAPPALPDADTFWLGVYRILAGTGDWWLPALLGGVTPLALLGAARRASRPLLRRFGYLLLLTLALPFAASVYTGDSRSVPFFADDVPRLLLLALPVLLPLALAAIWPRPAPPSPARPTARWLEAVAAAAAVVLAALPPLALDSYRRVDLRGPRDGRLVLALCRESLAVARRLERGKLVSYDPEDRRFTPGKVDPHLLERMRWFLRDGWGPMPHYATGPVIMQAAAATLLLPCFRPADLDLVLTLSAPSQARLRVEVNGHPIGELGLGPGPAKQQLRIQATALFRGDNALRLVGAGPGARLHALVLRPATS